MNAAQLDQLLERAAPGSLVHLVGAGGCGMSGLGHLLLDLGFRVSGSDVLLNEEVRQLQSRGARIFQSHAHEHVDPATILLCYTSAVRPTNPELQAAASLGLPVVRRAILLSALFRRQRSIGVAGMHGKSTTSAWLAFALERLGQQPSYAVGALIPQLELHARFRVGSGFLVAEVDESDGTLREFHPDHAILLNVDAEHLDYFGDVEKVVTEFRCFAEQTRGTLVFSGDDARLAELLVRNPRAVSFGFHPLSTYRVEVQSMEATAGQTASFEVWHKGTSLGHFEIQLLGQHNIANAAGVIAMLHQLGFAPREIAEAIRPFRGVARRQQELCPGSQIRIFEDYGHHPTEIRATLRALKLLRPKRLLVAFQPHRFTRTQHLWHDFTACFADADLLWLTDIYPASEPAIAGISSESLAAAMHAAGRPVEAVLPLSAMGQALAAAAAPGDIVLFLGAGDIGSVGRNLAAGQSRAPLAAATSANSREFVMGQGDSSPEMSDALCAKLAARLTPGTIARRDEPLAKRTTLRVGGKADFYVEPSSEAELAEVLRFCSSEGVPFLILGRGSNLLVRDGGIRGVVLCLAHSQFAQVQVEGERLRCGAGAKLKHVAVEARRHGLSGLEFLEGIPGSLGGAMRMNAGAMGSWLFDVVETIRFMDFKGEVNERKSSEVNVEYRGCPLFRNHVALGAVLHGIPAAKEAIQARMESFSKKRWESQPNQPSAGCIFKNPPTIPAGKLIDELGLKGARVGGAIVSDVHANFIVNDGTATARDVLGLIQVIKDRAKSARGIELQTEVEILGEG